MNCSCGHCNVTYEDALRNIKLAELLMKLKADQAKKLETMSAIELHKQETESGSFQKRIDSIFVECGFAKEQRLDFDMTLAVTFDLFANGGELDVEGMKKELNEMKQNTLN